MDKGGATTAVRQSILSRPVKKQNLNNAESLQLEHEKEQVKLQMKREKYQQMHEARRKTMWGSAEEKMQIQFVPHDLNCCILTHTFTIMQGNETRRNESSHETLGRQQDN